MKAIFVVWGGDYFERTDNLRAFESEDQAKQFVDLMLDYQNRKPRFDTSERFEIDSDEFSRRFDVWSEAVADWERGSPAHQGYRGADEFGIDQIDLYEVWK